MTNSPQDLTKKTPEPVKPEVAKQENITENAPPPPKIKNLRYMRDKDREMVKGIFRFYEVPGGSMSFSFKKYKEDQVETFSFQDGEVYTIPLGVAKHLNKNCNYPVYEHIPGEPGVLTGGYNPNSRGGPLTGMKVGRKVQRVGFQSLEFSDIEGLEETPELYTAELEPILKPI